MVRREVPAPAQLVLQLLVGLALLTTTVAQDTLNALGNLLPPSFGQDVEQLIRAASKTCEVLPLNVLLARTYSYELPLTDIVEYTNTARRSYRVAAAPEQLRIDRNSPELVLYIPGWLNRQTDESTRAIVKALLTKHQSVLVLDTCPSFCRGYVSSVSSVTPLSHLLYDFIKKMHKDNFPVSSIHIVGFSLGAHVAGMTGKLVQKRLKAKLGRITALDPARPCFARTEYRLDKRDAKFVQVIHSSSGVVGLEEPIGHVDVYINGVGRKHPECRDRSISLECDHSQSWRLYSASVEDETALTGLKCSDWSLLVKDKCTGNMTVLGYAINPKTKGIYVSKTKEADNLMVSESKVVEIKVFNPFEILLRPFQWKMQTYS